MFTDSSRQQKIASRIERVAIVDAQPQSARLLGDLLRADLSCEVFNAVTVDNGFAIASAMDPQIFFVEHPSAGIDGYALTRRIRRSDLDCRMAPIIMVTAEATAAAILAARDAGLHEFLRKPYTARDLNRRLEAVTLKPRDWVEAVQYIGPDRRRFNSADYSGPRKRRNDADRGSDLSRMTQALKIVRSAANALDSDLMQVRRALMAQAVELKNNAAAPPALKVLATAVGGWCARAEVLTPQLRMELASRVAEMVVFIPTEPSAEKAA
jgi:DNA-binding response OmpR family regulator